MNTFSISYPLYCFNEQCYQSVYNPGRRIADSGSKARLTMKHYCPSCKHALLSALDIELENMAVGGGLSFSEEILVREPQ